MRLLELFALQVHEGPCLDCCATGEAVVNVTLDEASDRWPRSGPAASQAGFGAAHALPLRLRGQVTGSLNLFTDEARDLADRDIALGQAMADIATIGLLHERHLHEKTALSEQLQTALHSRVLIEQAKGMLSAKAGMNVNEAFTRMRQHARSEGATLNSVASRVLDGSLDVRGLFPA